MTALASVRRRNTWVALAAGVVALALVPVAVVVAGTAITSSSAAVNVGEVSVLEIPPTPVGLLSTVDGTGALTAVTAFALAPSGSGGTVVSVPVGARVRSTGYDPDDMSAVGGVRLADVYAAEGSDAYHREVSSLLNASLAFDDVLSLDLATSMLEASGLAPGAVASVMAVGRTEAQVAEMERWAALGAAWGELVAGYNAGSATVSGAVGEPAVAEPDDLASLIEALFSGPVAYHQLAINPVLSSEGNPNGLDLYDVDRGEVVLVMASVAPSAVVAANPSVAVQVDSRFDFEVTKRAVSSLLFVGANVLLVRQVAEPAATVTQLRTSVRLSTKDVKAFESLFGAIEVIPAEQRVEGIDVQIRLGTAFAEAEDE